jgi:hypothetical protein
MAKDKKITFVKYLEFVNECLNYIRHDSSLDLIDNWDRGIIYKKMRPDNNDFWTMKVCFSREIYTDELYCIDEYYFSYLVKHETFYVDKQSIYRDQIQALSKFEKYVEENKGEFFTTIQDEYKKLQKLNK